jgi:hypothetical protein
MDYIIKKNEKPLAPKNNLNPVAIYENADTQKELIVEDSRGKAGVYR